ncbi:MerR family transcriptional regulator [Heyndrickxia sporothermodurans]
MLYTVKEISEMANVTIKTLYHYHKLGLLLPSKISEAGYRLYGQKELERLQEILFFRELDFPLKEIKTILDGQPERLSILSNQKRMLQDRKQILERLIQTIDQSIQLARKGEHMDQNAMFKGFQTKEEWEDALSEQRNYLKETYDYDIQTDTIHVEELNTQAMEAKNFIDQMAKSLKNQLSFDDHEVQSLINEHIKFLSNQNHITNVSDFAAQARFFLNDEFHRKMLELQQILTKKICSEWFN